MKEKQDPIYTNIVDNAVARQSPKKNAVKSFTRDIIKYVQITLNLLRGHQAEKPTKLQWVFLLRKRIFTERVKDLYPKLCPYPPPLVCRGEADTVIVFLVV